MQKAAVQKKQAQAAEQFANDLIRQVTEGMTVTIPDAMVENQLDGLINELRGHLQAQGVSLEQYLEAGNTTMEQLRDHARQQHKRRPEPGGRSLHSHIDDAPQNKGKGDAGNAQHRLYCNQNAYQKLGFSRYDAEPL